MYLVIFLQMARLVTRGLYNYFNLSREEDRKIIDCCSFELTNFWKHPIYVSFEEFYSGDVQLHTMTDGPTEIPPRSSRTFDTSISDLDFGYPEDEDPTAIGGWIDANVAVDWMTYVFKTPLPGNCAFACLEKAERRESMGCTVAMPPFSLKGSGLVLTINRGLVVPFSSDSSVSEEEEEEDGEANSISSDREFSALEEERAEMENGPECNNLFV
jgi:hypothetical protein